MLVETILGQEVQKHPLTKKTSLRSSSQSIKIVLKWNPLKRSEELLGVL